MVVLAWILGLALNRSLRRVTGDSMRPVLEPGDVVVVVPGRFRRLRRGDVVVVGDPREPERSVIKRVTAVLPGGVEVEGDNRAASTDSRAYGAVPPELVRSWVPIKVRFPPAML